MLTKKYFIAARNLFLTYKTDMTNQEILEKLKSQLSTQGINAYLIVREGEIGHIHIHVYIQLRKKLVTKNEKYLDIIDIKGEIIHGNYQVAKKPNMIIEYMLKDIKNKNDTNMIYSENISLRIDELGNWMDFGQSILRLAEQGKIKEALELYKIERPLEYIKNKKNLEKSLRSIIMEKLGCEIKFDYRDYIIPSGLKEILNDYNSGKMLNKTLVLIGPSGTGKTSFMESFVKNCLKMEPLMINNIDSLRQFEPGKHNFIIFDDVFWSIEKNREEVLKLLDSERATTHNIKHSSVTIPYPTPRVAITNKTYPFIADQPTIYQDLAVQRRIKIYVLDASLIPQKI